MADLITGGEKSKDVPSMFIVPTTAEPSIYVFPGAQRRLELHHEYRYAKHSIKHQTTINHNNFKSTYALPSSMTIDAQQGTVQAFLDMGDKLVDEGHYKASEIDEKLKEITDAQSVLESVWTRTTDVVQRDLTVQLMKRDALDV